MLYSQTDTRYKGNKGRDTMIKLFKSKLGQLTILTALCVICMAPLANASVCTIETRDGNECTINYGTPVMLNNSAKTITTFVCKKPAQIKLYTGLYQESLIGYMHEITSKQKVVELGNSVSISLSVTCRYGTRYDWQNISKVWVNRVFINTFKSPQTSLKCDI